LEAWVPIGILQGGTGIRAHIERGTQVNNRGLGGAPAKPPEAESLKL